MPALAIPPKPPKPPTRSAEFTEASRLSALLRPPPPSSPKKAARASVPRQEQDTNRTCGLTKGLRAEGNVGREASRVTTRGQWWRAGACWAALVARARTQCPLPPSKSQALEEGPSSYRPLGRTLTYFMPEIFKLFLSKRPIDCGIKRATTELNHTTVSIIHPHFHEKETTISGISPASKPSRGHTARKQVTRSGKAPISKVPSLCSRPGPPATAKANWARTQGQRRERGSRGEAHAAPPVLHTQHCSSLPLAHGDAPSSSHRVRPPLRKPCHLQEFHRC